MGIYSINYNLQGLANMLKTLRSCSWLVFFLMSSLSFSQPPANQIKVKPDILIGMTVPLSGELKLVGVGEKEGVEVVFKKVNAEGGIDGRKLKLIALDDYYDPIRAGKTCFVSIGDCQ